mmetsp:Transcript_1972/g.5750  ORF Transcript_1972/g.5750 Transcript_1972/m.5750 type:complete len:203 (-) Transcript_1972:168-776(-)
MPTNLGITVHRTVISAPVTEIFSSLSTSLHAASASSLETVFQPPRNSSNSRRQVLPEKGDSTLCASAPNVSSFGREDPSTGQIRSAKRELNGLAALEPKNWRASWEGTSDLSCALRNATCLQTIPTDRKRLDAAPPSRMSASSASRLWATELAPPPSGGSPWPAGAPPSSVSDSSHRRRSFAPRSASWHVRPVTRKPHSPSS